MNEKYYMMDLEDEGRTEYPLSATTDRGARIQAKKAARELPTKKYAITFFRQSDGCHGWIEV